MNGLLASKRCHSNSYIRNIRRWLSSTFTLPTCK